MFFFPSGSPFVQEIAELEKPTAHGDGLYRGVPGKPATFTVDPRGFPGQVSVAVTGKTSCLLFCCCLFQRDKLEANSNKSAMLLH